MQKHKCTNDVMDTELSGGQNKVWVQYSLLLKDQMVGRLQCTNWSDIGNDKNCVRLSAADTKNWFPKKEVLAQSTLIVTDKNYAGHRIERTTNQDVYRTCCIESETLQV